MNVRISKTWQVAAVVISPKYSCMQINPYKITANMITASPDSAEQNVAYQRLGYWLHDIFQDSFIISDSDNRKKSFENLNERVIVFPDDPVDQLVGIALYCKFSAMVQERLIIDSVLISSLLDDQIIYTHEHDDDVGIFSSHGWWSDPGPGWFAKEKKQNRGEKVIKLGRDLDWKDHGLDWNKQEDSATSVITVFSKDENQ